MIGPSRRGSAATQVVPPVVEVVDVTRDHPGGVRALRGVSLAVWPGELLAVVGPSGSGKSSLLQLLGTLDRPTSGRVLVHGTDVGLLPDREVSRLRREAIGFVFQSFHLSPLMSVRDNVAEGSLYGRVRRGERIEQAESFLSALGLGHRLDHRPHALSGGERQRVAIARALMGRPAVVLADEPTGNLDTANGEAVLEILRGLSAAGTAVVVITHDHQIAAGMDRRIELRDGLVERAEPHQADLERGEWCAR